jgi:PRC-barrel domain
VEGEEMASAIDDVSNLPGESVCDQDGLKIGKVKRLYSGGDDQSVMWVTVETSIGIGNKREVFVPLARLKHENDELRVPYSTQHLQSSPEVNAGEELSEGDDQALRAYYSIGLADQELRTDNDSYAGQVPDAEGTARQIDAEEAQEPERETGEARERILAKESEEQEGERDKPRKATTDDLLDNN